MKNWVCDFYLTYNKVFKNKFFLILETKWQRNNCVNKRRFFQKVSGTYRTAVHLQLEQKTKFFFNLLRFARKARKIMLKLIFAKMANI